jgi:transposase-like protein
MHMLQIMVNGRPLSPERAIREQLPLDTMLVCPNCESSHVVAGVARAGIRFDGEKNATVPRQQDRRCLACNHRWMAVLPPESVQVR